MANSSLVLDPIPQELKVCQPNLMPFHIAYSGPAPISTFLRVKPVERPTVEAPNPTPEPIKPVAVDCSNQQDTTMEVETRGQEEAVNGGEIGSNQQAEVNGKDGEANGLLDSHPSTVDSAEPPNLEEVSKAEPGELAPSEMHVDSNPDPEKPSEPEPSTPSRFISTFRGRTIQGLTVDLPQGYRGLVLRAPNQPESQANLSKPPSRPPPKQTQTQRAQRSTKSKGRLTRSAVSKRAVATIDLDQAVQDDDVHDHDDTMDVDSSQNDDNAEALSSSQDDAGPLRRLTASAQFSSFVLWQPDNPVVETQDEYFRAMHEWTSLAAEIHQSEEL